MNDETVDICTGLFLVGGVADRPEEMQSPELSLESAEGTHTGS